MNTGSLWSKQEACFAHATSVWLAVNHNISVTSMSDNFDKYCMGKRAWQLSIKLCHSFIHEAMNSSIDLSFATGRIACDYYARECEFGILKKQNKTKQKNKQEKSFGCVLTKWGVPLVWELTTEGERPFHCGIVRLQKFKDSLKARFEKYCCSKRKSKQNQISMSQKYMG